VVAQSRCGRGHPTVRYGPSTDREAWWADGRYDGDGRELVEKKAKDLGSVTEPAG
jgi:hypothetical protein